MGNPHPLQSKNATCSNCGEFKECIVGCHSWPKLNSVIAKCSSCKDEEQINNKALLNDLVLSPKVD